MIEGSHDDVRVAAAELLNEDQCDSQWVLDEWRAFVTCVLGVSRLSERVRLRDPLTLGRRNVIEDRGERLVVPKQQG
jgi:hypothetical protein